jgi:hypothetical protein
MLVERELPDLLPLSNCIFVIGISIFKII